MSESKYHNIDYNNAIQLVRSRLIEYQPRRIHQQGIRNAAVMVLFLKRESDEPNLLFTKRTDLVETHKGQISFPGGMADPADEDLLMTALRETEEEVGIGSENIEPLGRLDDFYTVTNFIISPFAGSINGKFQYKINHQEVAEVLEVPLALFLTDNYFEIKKWEYKGMKFDVYFYHYKNNVIWGATAFILNRFIHNVFDYNPAPKPITEDPRNILYLTENKNRNSQNKI